MKDNLKKMSRRDFLKMVGLGSVGLGLAACAPSVVGSTGESPTEGTLPAPVVSGEQIATNTEVGATPSVVVELAQGEESPFVGLRWAQGPLAVSKEQFDAVNEAVGCEILSAEAGQLEVPTRQLVGVDGEGKAYLAGSAVDPRYLDELFRMETGKDGVKVGSWNGVEVKQLEEFLYVDDQGKVFLNLVQGVSGVGVVCSQGGRLMQGAIDPETSKLVDNPGLHPAFQLVEEMALRENFAVRGKIELTGLEKGEEGLFTGRLNVLMEDGTEVKQRFVGRMETEMVENPEVAYARGLDEKQQVRYWAAPAEQGYMRKLLDLEGKDTETGELGPFDYVGYYSKKSGELEAIFDPELGRAWALAIDRNNLFVYEGTDKPVWNKKMSKEEAQLRLSEAAYSTWVNALYWERNGEVYSGEINRSVYESMVGDGVSLKLKNVPYEKKGSEVINNRDKGVLEKLIDLEFRLEKGTGFEWRFGRHLRDIPEVYTYDTRNEVANSTLRRGVGQGANGNMILYEAETQSVDSAMGGYPDLFVGYYLVYLPAEILNNLNPIPPESRSNQMMRAWTSKVGNQFDLRSVSPPIVLEKYVD